MTSILSKAVGRIADSPTLGLVKVTQELKAKGVDVIGLGAGEPDFPTPDHVKQAGIAAIEANKTGYTAVDGIPELKDAVIKKFRRDNELEYKADQIHCAPGGKPVIFNALASTLDAGQEVVIPAPYWVTYPEIVQLLDGAPVIVPTRIEDGFKLTPDALDAAITPKTKWVILNSPSNPTGMGYERDELRALAEVLLKHPHVWIMSDDMYEHIAYDGFEFSTIAQVEPALYARTLTLNGVSKAYSMTGWRLGYAGGPAELIGAMRKVISQTTSNPCSITQWAAVAALNGDHGFLAGRNEAFRKRRDLMLKAINDAPGLAAPKPNGAFYIFVDAAGAMGKTAPSGKRLTDDMTFCAELLEAEAVAVVPGTAFGQGPGFRLSYATDEVSLQKAGERIARFCAALK